MSRTVKYLRLYLADLLVSLLYFIDAGRRDENSESKNFITCCTTCCMNFMFALAPQGAPMRVIQVDIEGYCSSSAFMSQLRNFKLRKPAFHNGSQPHLPNICLEERCFLHFTTHKQTCSLFYMEALSLSSKDVCYTNILEMIVQNKKLSVYLTVRCSEMREMQRIPSQH